MYINKHCLSKRDQSNWSPYCEEIPCNDWGLNVTVHGKSQTQTTAVFPVPGSEIA